MDNLNFWEHDYNTSVEKKKYKVEFINNHPDDDNPDDPLDITKIRPELDRQLNKFLDAYHVNPLIPMRLELSGNFFQVSMSEDNSIKVEKLAEDSGLKGYGHISE